MSACWQYRVMLKQMSWLVVGPHRRVTVDSTKRFMVTDKSEGLSALGNAIETTIDYGVVLAWVLAWRLQG